ncbi:MAG: hypothetical protein ABIB61_00140 [Candidatus Shapirobacteria bacterium]
MKKLFFVALLWLFFAFPASTGAVNVSGNSATLKSKELASQEIDERVLILQSFLQEKDSPLTAFAADFVQVADKNKLDWRLLPAIAGLESSFGKRLIVGSFNPFGWGGGYIYFASWKDGFEKVARGLNKTPYPENKSPQKLGPVYAPPNPKWGYLIANIMDQVYPSSR